ncbi:hypothetical protein AAFF_G00350730 [Aldrovandia affinis]|uniref:B30.2/SPRY domain-containing protein n=1 Tax=Aldrovandia affinis TaxID=143900 RepID=A0AAD7W007_9TELE|nr:hypothetical protein AAFF_G00350730 [Aldrovandia affinis]
MEKTVDDFILDALDSLSADQLDRFKHKLSTQHKIGYGLIEKESNMGITRRIITKFMKKHAIARTVEVLRAIGLHDPAEDLEKEYASQGASSPAGTRNARGRSLDSSFTRKEVEEVHILEPRTRKDFLQYSCHITLDPNTAYRLLRLSEGNREVTRVEQKQLYPDHPERFDYWDQVLCREGLSGRSYWEAEWSGGFGVFIAVSYKGISRKGKGDDCALGSNVKSWSLFCSPSSCYFRHNKERTELPAPPSSRIGVYLDHGAGTLSFYSVSDSMTLLYRVKTRFTQPLYPGVFLYYDNSSLKLCDLG